MTGHTVRNKRSFTLSVHNLLRLCVTPGPAAEHTRSDYTEDSGMASTRRAGLDSSGKSRAFAFNRGRGSPNLSTSSPFSFMVQRTSGIPFAFLYVLTCRRRSNPESVVVKIETLLGRGCTMLGRGCTMWKVRFLKLYST